LAYDVIREVVIGGNFLSHDHTVNNFKNELWEPELFVRESYSDWLSKGRKNVVNNVINRCEEIVKKNWPCEPAVDASVKKELDRIYTKAQKELAGS
jgi:trimethylamine--corrinoid protein Co-methyltransferase